MMLVAVEELSKVCATSGLILAVQELGSLALKLAGTEEQKQRFLPAARVGRVARRVRPDRGGLGLRLGGDAHDRAARRRRRTSSTGRSASSRTPASRSCTRSSRRRTPAPATRASRASSSRPTRRASRWGGSSRRWGSRARRRASSPDRLPRARREPHRRGGRGLPDRDARPRPLPAGHRRAGARASRRARPTTRSSTRGRGRRWARRSAEHQLVAGDARRHGDEVRGGARAPLPGRPHARRGRRRPRADEGVRDGEALLLGRRDGRDDRRRADPRRVRLHAGVPGRADDARREDHADLRGHEPDPAPRDRARDAEGEPRLPASPASPEPMAGRCTGSLRAPLERFYTGRSADGTSAHRRRPGPRRRDPRRQPALGRERRPRTRATAIDMAPTRSTTCSTGAASSGSARSRSGRSPART